MGLWRVTYLPNGDPAESGGRVLPGPLRRLRALLTVHDDAVGMSGSGRGFEAFTGATARLGESSCEAAPSSCSGDEPYGSPPGHPPPGLDENYRLVR